MATETEDAGGLTDRVHQANRLLQQALELLPWDHPVGAVQWIHIDQVDPNDYNPNSVAPHEMRLLYTSIAADGYTQPVVTIQDPDTGRYQIVDGFHRYQVMKHHPDIKDSTAGYLPVVVIDKPIADRIASTVRHNRARGKHSITGMSSLVFRMLDAGVSDADICNQLGLEAEELARLKHITGFAKLHAEHQYSDAFMTDKQVEYKAEYKADHPDETMPAHF